MWCTKCNRETVDEICEICETETVEDIPVMVHWCENCKTPIIITANQPDKNICPLCNEKTRYLAMDIRPVFPEERLLVEVLLEQPFAFKDKSVWSADNRYYIDGETKSISMKSKIKLIDKEFIDKLAKLQLKNSYEGFNKHIGTFLSANKNRLNYLIYEASNFVKKTAEQYPEENIVISFSGGKDSTVTADIVIKALGNPSLVHIFGDTTLEFPTTMEYAKKYRDDNPQAIFKTAKNKEQNFYEVCKDIGPPARMMRWCCSMFKTGPITRVLNGLYRNINILTFYGIRKNESVSRSKYNRVEDNAEAIKINKQKVASPIFLWKDIDIWLYILGEDIDFNNAYRLGFDRVGCWCCPNNSERANLLSKLYMPERYNEWRDFLIGFAKKIGKPDAEVYVDTGKWKARQGGNGLEVASDVKIRFTNCTAEDNAKIYKLNQPVDEKFLGLMIPFGKVSKEMGRKLIKETIILDIRTNVPIISIQPITQEGYEYAVKIKTMNIAKHDDMQRKLAYQVRKFNACRNCLKCESLCKFGAISIIGDDYIINDDKCTRCKMCVTAKYLDGGCLMDKYLKTKE